MTCKKLLCIKVFALFLVCHKRKSFDFFIVPINLLQQGKGSHHHPLNQQVHLVHAWFACIA